MSRGNAGQLGPYRAPISGVLSLRELQQAVVEALLVLVAGGASGGAGAFYGGGGCGGFRNENLSLAKGVAYPILIGKGGVGVVDAAGNNGADSVLAGITAIGGGKAATAGGSGGGAIAGSPGTGTAGQGNAGGASGGNGGGGGGGAGSTPSTPAINYGGNGGEGIRTFITGSPVMLAAGGGGLGNGTGNSAGGSGIGGTSNWVGDGYAGAANTGSGGGAGAAYYKGGNGADGVGYLRVPDSCTVTFSAGVTATMSTAVSGYKVYTITATATGSETFVVF